MSNSNLTPSQAWHLQWVAAAYPNAFREVSRSTAMNSLVRKGLATKRPTDGSRQHRCGEDRLSDFTLTHDGLEALRAINSDLHARIDAWIDSWMEDRGIRRLGQ